MSNIYACEKYTHKFSERYQHQKNIILMSEIFSEMYACQKYIICMSEIYICIFRNMSQLNLVCRISSFLWFECVS